MDVEVLMFVVDLNSRALNSSDAWLMLVEVVTIPVALAGLRLPSRAALLELLNVLNRDWHIVLNVVNLVEDETLFLSGRHLSLLHVDVLGNATWDG